MFELQYEPLIISENLKPLEIALVPWDTETFGFGVSVLSFSGNRDQDIEVPLLKKALEAYSKDKQVQLIIASIPFKQNAKSLLLQRGGFLFIDLSLCIRYENFKDILTKSPSELSLSRATPEELEILVKMAGCSFRHGRYHLDPLVPKPLADQRYGDWLSRCFNPENPQQVLAVKHESALCGFSVVEHKDSEGYMHLHAIDSKWRGKKLGTEMILQSLRYLHDLGAKTVGTKISASNLKALNIHSHLNGRFIGADRLLHWHC